MTRLRSMLALALFSLAFPAMLRAQQQPAWEIEALNDQGWAEFNFQTGLGVGTNGVLVRYGNAFVTADSVSVNQQSGEVAADGHVRIQSEEQIWAGEHIRYNFKTRQIEAQQFRTGQSPIFAAGEGLHGLITNRVYVATNAVLTVDDVSEPAIKVRAKSIKILPGDKVVAHHATLYLAGVPVFYTPYYSRKLGVRSNRFSFVPGYRSSWGPFLLSGYNFYIGEEFDGIAHVDYRERRGWGAGPDLNYHLGRWGEGTAKYYYLYDQDPAAGGNSPNLDPNRQRVYFSYLGNPATNLSVKALVQYQTDTNIVREFFEGDYRLDNQPKTFFEVNRFWQNFSADAYVQPQVNSFLDTIERLPEARLTGQRQQLWESPIYYESVSSAGYYRHAYGLSNDVPTNPDYEAARVDTFHQLLLPHTFFDWLNVIPRVGGRYTYYGDASGPGATTGEVNRWVLDTGAEVTTKASRVWPGARNSFLEVEGLRHIIEPALTYTYVPTPNAWGTNQIPQFDSQMPSLRLLPITFPEYNSIDSIQADNVMRFGLRNKLQTKRDGRVVNLVDWNVYMDWYLRPQAGQSTYSDLYSDLSFKPRSWLTLESLTRYEIQGGQFRMSLTTATFQPNNIFSWTVGQFYVQNDISPSPTALGVGNNAFFSTMLFRLDENWGFRTAQYFDADSGTLRDNGFAIYRDMRSWTAALAFRWRENSNGSTDFTFAFTFSLKAAPRYGRGAEIGTPYWLLGG
jgi:LPS-assembly protein